MATITEGAHGGKQIHRDKGARFYRVHKSVKWGHFYNAATQTHDCVANSAQGALDILRPDGTDGFSTMQVNSGGRWQWVTETPEHLGGIAKHWHGERV